MYSMYSYIISARQPVFSRLYVLYDPFLTLKTKFFDSIRENIIQMTR